MREAGKERHGKKIAWDFRAEQRTPDQVVRSAQHLASSPARSQQPLAPVPRQRRGGSRAGGGRRGGRGNADPPCAVWERRGRATNEKGLLVDPPGQPEPPSSGSRSGQKPPTHNNPQVQTPANRPFVVSPPQPRALPPSGRTLATSARLAESNLSPHRLPRTRTLSDRPPPGGARHASPTSTGPTHPTHSLRASLPRRGDADVHTNTETRTTGRAGARRAVRT